MFFGKMSDTNSFGEVLVKVFAAAGLITLLIIGGGILCAAALFTGILSLLLGVAFWKTAIIVIATAIAVFFLAD